MGPRKFFMHLEASGVMVLTSSTNSGVVRSPVIMSSVVKYSELTRVQFPIRLAFAMIVNKSQGQSLSSVGIDLRNEVFSHGKLYVSYYSYCDEGLAGRFGYCKAEM
jgi:hypothetical protein